MLRPRVATRGLGRDTSVEQPVADDAVERVEGVAQADLLALFVRAAGIANGDFVDTPRWVSVFGYLGGDFRFESEPVLMSKLERLDTVFEVKVAMTLATDEWMPRARTKPAKTAENHQTR